MEYTQLSNMSARELTATRRKLAKRANQRLLRLERSSSKVTGEAYHAGAYDQALEYLREIGREKRFSESVNYTKTINEDTGDTAYDMYRLKREIMQLDTFLHSKSSTISGNREIEKKRIETFTSEKFNLSPETVMSKGFYDFLQSEAYEFFVKNSFTSEQLMDIYDTYRDEGASTYKIRQGIVKFKIDQKKKNVETTRGKQETATLSDLLESINKATGKNVKPIDVLNVGSE